MPVKYLLFFIVFFSTTSLAEHCGRIPDLGKQISPKHYFVGVVPVGGIFESETELQFGAIVEDGKFWFDDKFAVNASEATCLLPYFEDLIHIVKCST